MRNPGTMKTPPVGSQTRRVEKETHHGQKSQGKETRMAVQDHDEGQSRRAHRSGLRNLPPLGHRNPRQMRMGQMGRGRHQRRRHHNRHHPRQTARTHRSGPMHRTGVIADSARPHRT
nr:MAG TPA: hypothetical protein [Caudoviricetes sp.]